MNISEYKNIFDNEVSHFFYDGNHKIILSLLKQYIGNRRGIKILDAGCGTGLLAKKLKGFGDVWAVDLSEEAIKFARKRGVNAQKASVTKLPFKDGFFDAVTCIDVIYHNWVRDTKALAEFLRILRPGGILILRVPAHKWLYSSHDRHVYTRERYNKSDLRVRLTKAGFLVEKTSFVNMILFPLSSARVFLEKLRGEKATVSGVVGTPALLNLLLTNLISLESFLLRFFNLPFGIGLVAVGRKPLSGNKIASGKKPS